jgi:hypothetical protein
MEVLASIDFVHEPDGQNVYDVCGVEPVVVDHSAETTAGLVDREDFFGVNYLDFSAGWSVVV